MPYKGVHSGRFSFFPVYGPVGATNRGAAVILGVFWHQTGAKTQVSRPSISINISPNVEFQNCYAIVVKFYIECLSAIWYCV